MTTDNIASAIFAAELGGRHAEARRLRAAQRARWSMSTHDDNFKKALDALADRVIPLGRELVELRNTADRYPAAYVQAERARLLREAQAADAGALDLAVRYRDGALGEARKLRAQADIDRDPAERLAEVQERAALVAAGADGIDLAAQAAQALAAERPRRAAFLLSVARERGASPLATHELSDAVEAALDVSEPVRATARTIEEQVGRNLATFHDARVRTLAAAGVGLREDGSAGNGSSESVARANVERKMSAFFSGGDFGDAATTEGSAA